MHVGADTTLTHALGGAGRSFPLEGGPVKIEAHSIVWVEIDEQAGISRIVRIEPVPESDR
jgi:hypothetical protein